MHALVIHNEGAGSGETDSEDLVRAVAAAGYRVTCQDSDAMDLHGEPADLVVIAGGDGTVAQVLTRLPDRSVPVAIVPAGTANNVARSLGIGDVRTGLALVASGARHDFAIGVARWGGEEARFVEAVGFGPFVAMLRAGQADGEPEDKVAAGREVVRRAVAAAAALPVEVEVTGEVLCAGPLLVEVLNVGLAGPNIPLAPEANPGDGRLVLAWLTPERRDEMLAWIDSPGDGPAPLAFRAAREIRIRGAGEFRLDDGCRMLDDGDTLTVGIDGPPVQILVPGARSGRGRP